MGFRFGPLWNLQNFKHKINKTIIKQISNKWKMKYMKKKTSTFYELWQWRAWQGRRWTCREGHPNQRLWSDQNTDSATQHQTQDRSGHPTLISGTGNASAAEALRIGSEDRRWGWVGAVGQRRGSADGGSAVRVRVWEREWESGEFFRFQRK